MRPDREGIYLETTNELETARCLFLAAARAPELVIPSIENTQAYSRTYSQLGNLARRTLTTAAAEDKEPALLFADGLSSRLLLAAFRNAKNITDNPILQIFADTILTEYEMDTVNSIANESAPPTT